MRWFEVALFVVGLVVVGNGLLQWFGARRAGRDPAAARRGRRAAAVLVALGLVVIAVQVILVWG